MDDQGLKQRVDGIDRLEIDALGLRVENVGSDDLGEVALGHAIDVLVLRNDERQPNEVAQQRLVSRRQLGVQLQKVREHLVDWLAGERHELRVQRKGQERARQVAQELLDEAADDGRVLVAVEGDRRARVERRHELGHACLGTCDTKDALQLEACMGSMRKRRARVLDDAMPISERTIGQDLHKGLLAEDGQVACRSHESIRVQQLLQRCRKHWLDFR